MIKRLTVDDFRQDFVNYNRNYYSYEAYQAMFDYYNDIDENMELDVIAICGEWTEYDKDELMSDYGNGFDDFERTLDYLHSRTLVFELDNGNYLVEAF